MSLLLSVIILRSPEHCIKRQLHNTENTQMKMFSSITILVLCYVVSVLQNIWLFWVNKTCLFFEVCVAKDDKHFMANYFLQFLNFTCGFKNEEMQRSLALYIENMWIGNTGKLSGRQMWAITWSTITANWLSEEEGSGVWEKEVCGEEESAGGVGRRGEGRRRGGGGELWIQFAELKRLTSVNDPNRLCR